jgi:hypothetical protein
MRQSTILRCGREALHPVIASIDGWCRETNELMKRTTAACRSTWPRSPFHVHCKLTGILLTMVCAPGLFPEFRTRQKIGRDLSKISACPMRIPVPPRPPFR